MGLLTDIYNTVAKFFRQSDEPVIGEASKAVAANRLKLVLMQDRTNLTPKVLEQMRGEMIDLLSKYLEMDKDLLELNFEQEGDQVALMLSIPVIRAKDEDEIQASSVKENLEEESSEEEDNNEEEKDVENIEVESEIQDEVENSDSELSKSKKKKSKKVTLPEDLENSLEEKEIVGEHETVCENQES